MTTSLAFRALLLCASLSAWAQWSPQVIEDFTKVSTTYQSLDQAGIATFWGGLRRSLRLNFNDADVELWKTPLFRKGEIEVYLSQKDHPAPLVVFLPGIFGAINEGLTPTMIDHFEKLGAHVLVVPNILSVPYVTADPIYDNGVVAHEAAVMEWALQESLKRLGKKVKGVHVVAESLGSMVGVSWVALHLEKGLPLDSLTFLFPPLDLSSALPNFDGVIRELRPSLGACEKPLLIWKLFTNFILEDVPTSLTQQEKSCFAAEVVVKAFLKSATKAQLAHAQNIKGAPTEEIDSFDKFFRSYRPELWALIEKKDETLGLAYWIKRIRAKSLLPIRVLTSKNDFLNRGLSWGKFLEETKLPNDHVIILNWGGHSGPLGMKEFPVLLEKGLNLNGAK